MPNKPTVFACVAAVITLAACTTTATPASTSKKAQVASAQTGEREETTAVASADANEMICKREKVVGTNFKKKLCATQAQWDMVERQARESTGDMQRRGQTTSTNGN